MALRPFVGSRRVAVIPAIVDDPQFDRPPANYVDVIRQRFYFDPDPNTGVDRSLRAYFHAISYGKALLQADVLNPVTVPWAGGCGETQDRAIMASPGAAAYEYACVVFPSGPPPCSAWAFYDMPLFPFVPRQETNLLRNWCYVAMGEFDNGPGIWAMELLHIITAFGDLYDLPLPPEATPPKHPPPRRFDEMDCACGTHPSTFTKLRLGWLDPNVVPTMSGTGPTTFTLHALALLQPPPPGRVTAVRIPSRISSRYFLVEARLRTDQYERSTPGVSSGIPSEGVVVYEVDESASGPIRPVRLRTETAKTAGQTFDDSDERLTIEIASAVAGGFTITIRSTEHPDCKGLREEIREYEAEIKLLQEDLKKAESTAEKQAIIGQIKALQSKLRDAQDRAKNLGCIL